MRYLLIGLALMACDDPDTGTADTTTATTADTIDEAGPPETALGDSVITEPAVTTSELRPGVTRARIDATRETGWVRLRLSDGAQVMSGAGWDLEFQRILIRVNHPIAAVDVAFDEVTQAPAEGYVEDGDTLETLAFAQLGEWWSYDVQHHTVTPRVKTFVIKVDDESYFKLAVRDYYDDAGTTGLVTLDWASVAKP